MSHPGERRQRVAILGGGAAGVAAAFELTATDELRERFEVTLHTPGWRLGGKGASGRNHPRSMRIEEHGLHVWFGFYANSFGLLDRCLREVDREDASRRFPWKRVEQAFLDCDQLVLNEPAAGGGWRARCTSLPSVAPPGPEREIAFWGPRYLFDWFRPRAEELIDSAGGLEGSAAASQMREGIASAEAIAAELEASVPPPNAEGFPARLVSRALLALAEAIAVIERGARRLAEGLPPERRADALYVAQSADLLKAVAALVGRRVVTAYGADDRAPFDHLNVLDLREALSGRLGGREIDPDLVEDLRELRARGLLISEDTARASFVRVLYDLAFAYREGDGSRPDVAAGVGLENLLSIALRHDGRLMQKMRSGMGDVVFAPLHEALSSRRNAAGEPSVRFEFFNWISGIEGSEQGVERIHVVRQAQLDPGAGEYDPFPPGDEKLWPSEPREEQFDRRSRERLEELRRRAPEGEHAAAALEREADPLELSVEETLRRDRDFDAVVLAVPAGALPFVARPLVDSGSLERMLAASGSVMTQAMQVWLARGFAGERGLGWPCEGTARERISGGHAKPFDTCADMSHLMGAERWPSGKAPAGIAYFCGVLPERDGQDGWRQADERARENGLAFLQREFGTPRSPFWQAFTPDDLVDASGRSGWSRFAAQYWRANSTPWERYVTSHAGSIADRLRPDGRRADGSGEPQYENLALAGDWTYTPINAGSFEGAVIAGIEAAAALIGRYGGGASAPRVELPPWRCPNPWNIVPRG